MSVAAVIPAAGTGSRLKSRVPKPLVRLGSEPLFIRTIRRLGEAYPFSRIVLAVDPGSRASMTAWVKKSRIRRVELVSGGLTRAESVRNGLERLNGEKFVLIHDVARPFVGAREVRDLIRQARKDGASILALKATATVKEINPRDRRIRRTLDRNRIYLAQTPQVFRTDLLRSAYARLGSRFTRFTDEAGMMESVGTKVTVVEGSSLNIKITTPGDLALARAILSAKPRRRPERGARMRVGLGWDLHRLSKGKPFVLGGVRLNSPAGPVGHSDGDVLAHAVIDALLGAAGLGDIGEHFSDTDKRWRGASSINLLSRTMALVRKKGHSVINVDAVIVLEAPKLSPYKAAIRKKLAGVLGIAAGAVGIKAKTAEGLGPVGQKKAVSASCVVLLEFGRKK